MRIPRVALALACLLTAGCGSGGGTKTAAPGPGYYLAVAPSAAPTTLGTQVVIPVQLSATGGFTGSVALSAGGVPASWTAAITPADTVHLTGGSGSATLTLTIPSDGAAAPSGILITVAGTASVGDLSVATTVTVANQYVISITPGTGTGAHWGALSGTTLQLLAGSTLVVRNDDSVGHRLHTSGTIVGLPHQTATMAPGESYTSSTLSVGDDPGLYCHDHLIAAGGFGVHVH